MKSVHLPRTLVTRLLSIAQRSPDQEVCGIISGTAEQAFLQVHPVDNVAKHPQQHFHLDDKSLIDTLRNIREAGNHLSAIYHSHPNSPAKPSLTDIEQHGYPDALYLIISLNTEGVLEMRGYYIHNKSVEEAITLTE
ncbi:MAG: hypothetical protein BMS9Abin36_1542 [Gammaproteobacteria bacterium]|nr:MAG: hypothetical protein BMS9Abin36_1542 [Gammaproteobacteria bacterium]